MKISVSMKNKLSMDDFLTLMRIPLDWKTPDDRARILQLRVQRLGHGQYCSRCGGSGHYSYNLTSGTVCFKCKGGGYEPIPARAFNQSLYDKLAKDVAAGHLDTYLANDQLMRKARRVNSYAEAVMQAWSDSGVSKAYDWHKSAKGIQPDADISVLVNQPMHDAHERVCKLCNEVGALTFKATKARSGAEREVIEDEIRKAVAVVESEAETAKALIGEKAALIQGIIAKHAG